MLSVAVVETDIVSPAPGVSSPSALAAPSSCDSSSPHTRFRKGCDQSTNLIFLVLREALFVKNMVKSEGPISIAIGGRWDFLRDRPLLLRWWQEDPVAHRSTRLSSSLRTVHVQGRLFNWSEKRGIRYKCMLGT